MQLPSVLRSSKHRDTFGLLVSVLCYVIYFSLQEQLSQQVLVRLPERLSKESRSPVPVRKTCSYRCGDALSRRKGLHSTPRSAPEGRYSEEPVLGANNTQKISELQGTMSSPSREWEGGGREKKNKPNKKLSFLFYFECSVPCHSS